MKYHAPQLHPLPENFNYLAAQTKQGYECPCCERKTKLNKNSIDKHLLKCLIIAARKPDGTCTPEDINKMPGKQRGAYSNYSKICLWGLARKLQGEGGIRITDAGRQFLAGEIRIPEFIYTYNRKPRYVPNVDARMLTIHELPAYIKMNRDIAAQRSIDVKIEPTETLRLL